MYSYEERRQAVEWYYKLGSIKAVQNLLEYIESKKPDIEKIINEKAASFSDTS